MSETIGAIELGGTHVSAARVRTDRAAVETGSRVRRPIRPDGDRDELVGAILDTAAAVDGGIRRWGAAVPGPFDYAAGVAWISGVAKLEGLYGVSLRQELADALGVPGEAVVFLNDAEGFLLGEAWAGAARGPQRCVGITLGTGLGSAFLVGEEFVTEGPGVPPDGSVYHLSHRGKPVEETISSRGLRRVYREAGGPDIPVVEVFERARAGEPTARSTVTTVFDGLAEFLRPLLEAFGAEILVAGGSMARSWDLVGPHLTDGLGDLEGLEVTVADHLDDAPLLGAARWAWRETAPPGG